MVVVSQGCTGLCEWHCRLFVGRHLPDETGGRGSFGGRLRLIRSVNEWDERREGRRGRVKGVASVQPVVWPRRRRWKQVISDRAASDRLRPWKRATKKKTRKNNTKKKKKKKIKWLIKSLIEEPVGSANAGNHWQQWVLICRVLTIVCIDVDG